MSNIYNAPHPGRKPVDYDWGVADLPIGIREALGRNAGMTPVEHLSSVLSAFEKMHDTRPRVTREDLERFKRERKRHSPLHKKAVARRRKRKRGGPK